MNTSNTTQMAKNNCMQWIINAINRIPKIAFAYEIAIYIGKLIRGRAKETTTGASVQLAQQRLEDRGVTQPTKGEIQAKEKHRTEAQSKTSSIQKPTGNNIHATSPTGSTENRTSKPNYIPGTMLVTISKNIKPNGKIDILIAHNGPSIRVDQVDNFIRWILFSTQLNQIIHSIDTILLLISKDSKQCYRTSMSLLVERFKNQQTTQNTSRPTEQTQIQKEKTQTGPYWPIVYLRESSATLDLELNLREGHTKSISLSRKKQAIDDLINILAADDENGQMISYDFSGIDAIYIPNKQHYDNNISVTEGKNRVTKLLVVNNFKDDCILYVGENSNKATTIGELKQKMQSSKLTNT